MARLFILGGQSNMVGGGLTVELPAALRRGPANVRLLVDGEPATLAGGERFGPEVGLAHALAARLPGEEIVLCKVARGGANLYYDWDPDGRAGGPEDTYRGPLYPALLAAAQPLAATMSVAGMFWMQGERDSVFPHMAHAYGERLTAFIRRVRADLGTPEMPFVMGLVAPRIRDLDVGGSRWRHPWRRVVQAAQQRVANTVLGVAVVETRDLPQHDNLHFNAAGLVMLGERYAATRAGAGTGD